MGFLPLFLLAFEMSVIPAIKIENPLVASHYRLMWRYLKSLLDAGIQFLRNEYIAKNDQTTILRLSAMSFYDYILKDNIEQKVKNLLRVVINAGVECTQAYDRSKDEVDPDFLDKVVEKRYPLYAKNDMTLLHASRTHPVFPELEMISILTFRVATIQTTRMLSHPQSVRTYYELVRAVFPEKQNCINTLSSLTMMIDQMIDLFEQNLDIINIPVFQPTFSVRNFEYIRKLYEYAQNIIQEEVNRMYIGDQAQ
jgi:hypothetical protein